MYRNERIIFGNIISESALQHHDTTMASTADKFATQSEELTIIRFLGFF